jgi:hypothetical protein
LPVDTCVVTKKVPFSILTELRSARGVTKMSLKNLSGVSDFTIRRIEHGHEARPDTWKALIEALASVSHLTDAEIALIAEHLGWSRSTVAAANAKTPSKSVPSNKTPEARVLHVIRSNPEHATRLAGFLEAAARLLN